MKGLILKDIYNVRFQIIGGLVLLLLAAVGMIAAGEDLLNSEQEYPELMKTIVYGMINYLAITVCSSFFLNTAADDIKSGWAKMQLAMPVTCKEIIGGKLAATGLILGMLTFFSLIFNILCVFLFNKPLELMIAMPVVLALLQMSVLSATTVIGYRLQGKFMAVYFTVLLIVAAGITVLLCVFFTRKISVSVLRWISYGGVPLLSAIVTVSCYNLGCKAVGKIEK